MLLLTLLLALTAHAAENDDCTANWDELHSVLNTKALKSPTPEKRDEKNRVLTQSGTLKSGAKVKFQAGGCAHMAYSFEFDNVKLKLQRASNAFAAAEKLLNETPVTKESPEKKKVLLQALKETAKKHEYAQQSPSVYKLDCGDAQCLLDVSGNRRIVISYDMAL